MKNYCLIQKRKSPRKEIGRDAVCTFAWLHEHVCICVCLCVCVIVCTCVCVCWYLLRVTIVNRTNPPDRIMATKLSIQKHTAPLLTAVIRHEYPRSPSRTPFLPSFLPSFLSPLPSFLPGFSLPFFLIFSDSYSSISSEFLFIVLIIHVFLLALFFHFRSVYLPQHTRRPVTRNFLAFYL